MYISKKNVCMYVCSMYYRLGRLLPARLQYSHAVRRHAQKHYLPSYKLRFLGILHTDTYIHQPSTMYA